MADLKISEMTSASQVNNDDNVELSQGNAQSGFASVKATILAIAQKIITGINFTSALETENKTIAGAINEVRSGGGGSSTFAGLSDVDIDDTTLANGQVPVWDGTEEKWKNGNGGGGTTVIANPTGTPTDDLNSIQIGSDIYRIVGSGGGTAKALVMKTKTWTGNGDTSLVLNFDEKPLAIFNIFGSGLNGTNVLAEPFMYGETNYMMLTFARSGQGLLIDNIAYSNNDLTMTITGVDVGAIFNVNNAEYTMWYLVEEEVGGGSAGWTDITGTLTAGQTEIVLTSDKITTNSTVFPWTNKFGVSPSNMVVANGSVTLTFPVQTTDLDVMVRVTEVGGTPSSSSVDYSTTEQDTGVKWINGDTIYQKTVYSAGGTTGVIEISHGISNLEHCIYAEGWFHDTYSGGFDSPLPKLDALHNDIGITEITSTSVKCNVPSVYGDGRILDIYVTLKYTKSTT